MVESAATPPAVPPPAGKDGRKGWGCLQWGLLVAAVVFLAFCGITLWALMNADFR